jgi:spore maturation protein CgeB
MSPNINYVDYVSTSDHNAFNSTLRAVLNINRSSMASYGFSPPTRVFEVAAAGGCLITDAWKGIELFLEPDKEVLVAGDGEAVINYLAELDPVRARTIGNAAHRRILAEHTYQHRALQFQQVLDGEGQRLKAGV